MNYKIIKKRLIKIWKFFQKHKDTALICIAILTLVIAIFTLKKAQSTLELSTSPIMTIESDDINTDDLVETKLGFIKTIDSKANLILTNNFLGEIVDIDIRMVLLKMSKDTKSSHPKICFWGYVDHNSNPEFIVNNVRTDNVFNKKINLKPSEKYHFSIDYKNLNETIQKADNDRDYLIKIDVNYRRKIDNRPFYYSKIYHIRNSKYIVDTDINKTTILYNDLKNEILELTDATSPFIIHLFKEQEFIEAVKTKMIPPYTTTSSGCEYFKMDKKINLIE